MNTHRVIEAYLDKVRTLRQTEISEQLSVKVFVPSPVPFKITKCLCTQISAEEKIGEKSPTGSRA